MYLQLDYYILPSELYARVEGNIDRVTGYRRVDLNTISSKIHDDWPGSVVIRYQHSIDDKDKPYQDSILVTKGLISYRQITT